MAGCNLDTKKAAAVIRRRNGGDESMEDVKGVTGLK